MIFNRKNQILALEKLYKTKENEVVVYYSNPDSDIHYIINDFLQDKDYFYYKGVAVSSDEQLNLFVNSINAQLPKHNVSECSYEGVLSAIVDAKCEKRVVVIDEFQHIVKYSDELITEILKCINNKWGNQPVLFILVSSNAYFVENQMISKLDSAAYELSGLIKLPDLSFVDVIQYFDKYSKSEQIIAYAITSFKYSVITSFDSNISLKENIIRNILCEDGTLYKKGFDVLPKELREHSVYNTILVNIACGLTKLNDLHKKTGFSRAKISVYINNLIEHNLIEKIDSIDSDGKDNTIKGIYTIKDDFLRFFYRFVFPNASLINVLGEEKYYKKYIAPFLFEYARDTFRKVCYEYLLILNKMNKLPISITESGTWIGKVGNIDIVCKDSNEHTLIGMCEFEKDIMTFEDFEWLEFCVKQAKLKADVYYLFTRKEFDDRIKEYAKESGNMILIDLSML